MVFRKRTSRPRRSYRKMFRRRRHKASGIPLSAITGITTSVIAPAGGGWPSVYEAIRDGAFDAAGVRFVRAWTGLAIGGNGEPVSFNFMDALNPFNMNEAPAWKAMLWTALGAKIIKKVTHQDPFQRIPIIGKFIRFS